MSNVFSCQRVLRCVLFTQLKQACYHNRSKQAIKSTLKTLFGTPAWHSLQKRDEMVHIRGKFYLVLPNSFWKSNCSQEATESQWTDVWATNSSSLFFCNKHSKKKKSFWFHCYDDENNNNNKKMLLHFGESLRWNGNYFFSPFPTRAGNLWVVILLEREWRPEWGAGRPPVSRRVLLGSF